MDIDLLRKLFELQKLYSRKQELTVQRVELFVAEMVRDSRQELGHHKRDAHHQPYDSSLYMEFWREDQAKKESLAEEYRELCQQITELESEIEELLTTAAA